MNRTPRGATPTKPEDHVREIAQHIREVIWKIDPDTAAVVYVNPAFKDVFGIPVEELLANPSVWIDLVHDEDRERVMRLFRRCATEPVSIEYRIIRPDGDERWIVFHGNPVRSHDGIKIVGVCEDITRIKRAELEQQRAVSLLRATLDATADGILVVDCEGKISSYNRVFMEMWRIPEEVAATRDDAKLIASVADQLKDPDAFLRGIRKLYDHWDAVSFDTLEFKDGRHYERYSRPQYLEGKVVGRVWSFRDETARYRAEAGVRFLAEASRTLASSLDYTTTLHNLADLVVPFLADWFVVDVMENGRVRRIVSRHVDPRKEEILHEITKRYPPDHANRFRARLRRGIPEFVPEVTDEWLKLRTRSAEERRMLHELGLRSVIVAPLIAHERILGAITIGSGERTYTREDLTVAQDLALRAAVALENSRLYEDSQLANKAKSDFLAVMSHELRTPLAAITGYVDLIDAGIAGPLTDQQHAYLQRIQLQAQELIRVITEILTYSRTESERERIRVQRFDPRPLVERVAGAMRPFADDKGLRMEVEIGQLPPSIESDPARLENILTNLVSNAVKFTNRGYVRLKAFQDGDFIVFEVSDTGVGIAPEYQKKIFDPFFQVEDALTREKGGTGLGLAVARRLTKLIHGELYLHSEPGVGSKFTVRIPKRLDGFEAGEAETSKGD